MKKKILALIAIILCLSMVFALAACGSRHQDDDDSSNAVSSNTSTNKNDKNDKNDKDDEEDDEEDENAVLQTTAAHLIMVAHRTTVETTVAPITAETITTILLSKSPALPLTRYLPLTTSSTSILKTSILLLSR